MANLASDSVKETIGSGAKGFGLLGLLGLLIFTGAHAVNLVGHNANFGQDNPLAPVLYFGIVLVEGLALVTAVLLMTHKLRAAQKAWAFLLEATWVLFAAANLITSFGIDHNAALPSWANLWVLYGLPVSALIVGIEYYIAVIRVDPDANREDDTKELEEKFRKIQHEAEVEVLNSDQMKVVIRQMKWLTMPGKIGQMLHLSQEQIQYVMKHAPKLYDGDNDGVGDIMEGNRPSLPSGNHVVEQPHAAQQPDQPDYAPFGPVSSHFNLDDLLSAVGLTRQSARDTMKRFNLNTPGDAYRALDKYNRLPNGMTEADFTPLFNEIMSGGQGNGVNRPT